MIGPVPQLLRTAGVLLGLVALSTLDSDAASLRLREIGERRRERLPAGAQERRQGLAGAIRTPVGAADHEQGAGGFPGSVGLAADSTLDEDVGDCMVQTIRGWKMSSTLPGHVMRASFNIPPVIATAEASPHRAGGHRRHR